MKLLGPGTIDRPHTHEPWKQDPMASPTDERSGSATPVVTTIGATAPRQNRTLEMQLIPEVMARAHMHELRREADREHQARRLLAARRMQRRAVRASLRARRALAVAVMQ
jgi:hypothetical protein